VTDEREARGIPFRAMIPNAITALALCFGLTGVRFAIEAANGDSFETALWQISLACIVGAGILDGFDGRIARLLRANSKFGAELDSLSDNIAFGTAPALILFLWSLQTAPRFGWIAALALAVCCALRLARFNAGIDAGPQPHKEAGFNTGVPAPVGAGLAFVPIYLWLITGNSDFRSWLLVLPWTIFIALLMISSVPTYSWGSIRIRRGWRLFALAGVALLGAALLNEPWLTLLGISALYLAVIPFSIAAYARVKRRRASADGRAAAPESATVSAAGPEQTRSDGRSAIAP
jgi:CDP-diacylglycerol--serine O-phosphatidyltransferase